MTPAHLIRYALLTGILLVATQTARAQDVPMQAALPDTIVVTASRLPEDVRLSGRRVAVWTARDIENLPVTSVDELLRMVGGVEVQSRGGFGVQSDLTMRGSSFNGVLLLLDGARINDPMTAHFLTDLPIPLSEVARIEVVRGPAVTLYGPDAIGGVIQIFTYEGLRRAGAAAGSLGGSLHLDRGAYGLYDAGLAVRNVTGRTSLSAASAWQQSDGSPITGADGQPVRSTSGEVRTDFTRSVYTAAVTRELGRALLFARAGADTRDFGAFHYYTPFASDTAREATGTLWAQVRLSGGDARSPWQVQAAAKQHKDEYVYNPVTPANRHTSRLFTTQAHLTRHLTPGVSLTGGVAAMFRSIESNSLGNHADPSAGAFVLARWHPIPNLLVSAGGRFDYDPSYGLEPTPQLSAAYTRGIISAYVGTGRAVRAPNYLERYYNTLVEQPQGNLGNPDLDVETAWTHEAGLSLYPASGISLHASVFTRTTWDLIDYARFDAADPIFLARNLHQVRTRGLEFDLETTRSFEAGRVRAALSLTVFDSTKLGDLPDGVQYKYALTNARHLLQGMTAVDLGPVSVGLQGLWKDPVASASYAVLNAQLGYRFHLGRQRLTLRGEIRNLFDKQYSDVFDAPMPGRWWIFGVQLVR